MKRRISFQFYRDFIISRASILLVVVLLWNIAPVTNNSYNNCLPLGEEIRNSQPNMKQTATQMTLSATLATTREALWFSFRRAVSGWFTCPPQIVMISQISRKKKKKKKSYPNGLSIGHIQIACAGEYVKESYSLPLWRTLFLLDLWLASGQLLPEFLILLPSLEWLLSVLSVAWPWLGNLTEIRATSKSLNWLRVATLWLLGLLIVWQVWNLLLALMQEGQIGLVGGLILSGQQKKSPTEQQVPKVEILKIEGGHRIDLTGQFYLTVKDDDPFWQRMSLIFLRQLETNNQRRGGRPTRDGRRPYLSQQKLAADFGVTQSEISRWEKYWLDKDWANLLSLQSNLVLTNELRQQIVVVFARFPWWGIERVYQYLHQQGIVVTLAQVRQAARDSGWQQLRKSMNSFFVISENVIRPRDESLVTQLLSQLETLLAREGSNEILTPQQELEISHLQTAAKELGLVPEEPKTTFWGRKIQKDLFSAPDSLNSANKDPVCCTYCGSTKVRPKGRKGRLKRYLDRLGQWQKVEVFPHHCDNPDCSHQYFTHQPDYLVEHSPYTKGIRLQALYQAVVQGGSYRRVAAGLGVKSSRVYEWVSAFGQDLLPVGALFGVVRSSGVVGIDEKYVQVPDKAPRGSGGQKNTSEAVLRKKRRWMYVYLAVDVYTYDLLHIEIYAHNTAHSTKAFLLALKAKGYRPRVIVTDLRQEYGPAIEKVFPNCRHHECIFHALQWFGRQFKKIYGKNYDKENTDVVTLKKQIIKIFQTSSKRTAERRYQKVMALREAYVKKEPQVASVFDSLERHWPKLLNAIESTLIPRTNNAVELVIRRFNQLYKNFCGFDSIESARIFCRVFEKTYRFTPFTQDAQPSIRGKCPLELAGYDISNLPMWDVCCGRAIGWPQKTQEKSLPNT